MLKTTVDPSSVIFTCVVLKTNLKSIDILNLNWCLSIVKFQNQSVIKLHQVVGCRPWSLVPVRLTVTHGQSSVRQAMTDGSLVPWVDTVKKEECYQLHIAISKKHVTMYKPQPLYLPKGESKSGRSRATAIKTFFILALGTYPTPAVWYQRRSGKPLVMEGLFLSGAS